MSLVIAPGTWIGYDTAPTTVLTYALQTDPAPLTVSDSTTDVTLGAVQIVITNNTSAAVSITEIDFTVQVGTSDPTYGSPLMQTTANIGTAVSDMVNWTFPAPGTITSGQAKFALGPKTGIAVTLAVGASVTVEIYDFPTVLVPGTAIIQVSENTTVATGANSFGVTTFPAGFFFNNLVASVQSKSSYLPVAQVPYNTPVTLTWNSSVVETSSVTIYYTNATQPENPKQTGLWLSPNLTVDTVFTVVVTASIVGGQPISASLSVPVSVQLPALNATSLVAGTATVNGATTVNGVSTLNGATTITGTTTVNGGTTVNGQLNTTGLSVTGTMSSIGATQALTAPVPQQGSSTPATASYTAPTDGLVIGFVGAASKAQPTQLSIGYIQIQNSANAFVAATGGNFIIYLQTNNPPAPAVQFSAASLNQSIFLPVKKGETFTLSVTFEPNNQSTPQTNFWFIPIGTGTIGNAVLAVAPTASPAVEVASYLVPRGG